MRLAQIEREASSHLRSWRVRQGEEDAEALAAAAKAREARALARAKAEGKLQAPGWGFLKPTF
jgi:hypothetical protein